SGLLPATPSSPQSTISTRLARSAEHSRQSSLALTRAVSSSYSTSASSVELMSALLARRAMRAAISGLTLQFSCRCERHLALLLFVERSRALRVRRWQHNLQYHEFIARWLGRQATTFEPEPLAGARAVWNLHLPPTAQGGHFHGGPSLAR